MDKTTNYRKMAEKANEIQKLWNHEIGDYYFLRLGNIPKAEIINVRIIYNKNTKNWTGCFWLPRQDQLQDIIKKIYYKQSWTSTDSSLAQEFGEHLLNRRLWDVDASMEMLWLDWTMFLLCGKYWDGGEWIND